MHTAGYLCFGVCTASWTWRAAAAGNHASMCCTSPAVAPCLVALLRCFTSGRAVTKVMVSRVVTVVVYSCRIMQMVSCFRRPVVSCATVYTYMYSGVMHNSLPDGSLFGNGDCSA
ncbi:hypothetical protein COO60DRAFT_1500434 [Scenedesmus sp. NREL 46B-D3]|nr:hypothetical protein COO60DRAFT_1500434 [Scenedesmus sp. NREL 46B-D3]